MSISVETVYTAVEDENHGGGMEEKRKFQIRGRERRFKSETLPRLLTGAGELDLRSTIGLELFEEWPAVDPQKPCHHRSSVAKTWSRCLPALWPFYEIFARSLWSMRTEGCLMSREDLESENGSLWIGLNCGLSVEVDGNSQIFFMSW